MKINMIEKLPSEVGEAPHPTKEDVGKGEAFMLDNYEHYGLIVRGASCLVSLANGDEWLSPHAFKNEPVTLYEVELYARPVR